MTRRSSHTLPGCRLIALDLFHYGKGIGCSSQRQAHMPGFAISFLFTLSSWHPITSYNIASDRGIHFTVKEGRWWEISLQFDPVLQNRSSIFNHFEPGSVLKSRDITLPTKFCIVKAMVFPVARYRCETWTIKSVEELMLLNCGVGEDSWESLGLQGDQTSQT